MNCCRRDLQHRPREGARRAAAHRAAFTLLEILVTLTIVVAVTAVVAPMMSDDRRLRVMAAASILESDIELAQMMTIARPQSPMVVRFNPAANQYWLAYAATPNTPIARDDTGDPYRVTLGQGRARAASGVTIALDQLPANTINFAAHGGLTDFTLAPAIRLTSGTRGLALAISPDTGSITATEFEPAGALEVLPK